MSRLHCLLHRKRTQEARTGNDGEQPAKQPHFAQSAVAFHQRGTFLLLEIRNIIRRRWLRLVAQRVLMAPYSYRFARVRVLCLRCFCLRTPLLRGWQRPIPAVSACNTPASIQACGFGAATPFNLHTVNNRSRTRTDRRFAFFMKNSLFIIFSGNHGAKFAKREESLRMRERAKKPIPHPNGFGCSLAVPRPIALPNFVRATLTCWVTV